jgi:hypothetical protein
MALYESTRTLPRPLREVGRVYDHRVCVYVLQWMMTGVAVVQASANCGLSHVITIA